MVDIEVVAFDLVVDIVVDTSAFKDDSVFIASGEPVVGREKYIAWVMLNMLSRRFSTFTICIVRFNIFAERFLIVELIFTMSCFIRCFDDCKDDCFEFSSASTCFGHLVTRDRLKI